MFADFFGRKNPTPGRKADKVFKSSICETTRTLRYGDLTGAYRHSTSKPEAVSVAYRA